MNKKIILLLWLLLPSYIFAQDADFVSMDDPGILKEGLANLSMETNTIKSSFIQEKHMQILSRAIISKGSILFLKPDKLRWEYVDPFQYLIIINGDKIHIKNDGRTNTFDMSTSKLFLEINQLIINTVNGNILDEEKFDIAYFQSPSHYMARLFTKDENMKEFIAHLEISFIKDDFLVSEIKLVEPTNDYTHIKFTDSQYNVPLNDDSFILN